MFPIQESNSKLGQIFLYESLYTINDVEVEPCFEWDRSTTSNLVCQLSIDSAIFPCQSFQIQFPVNIVSSNSYPSKDILSLEAALTENSF